MTMAGPALWTGPWRAALGVLPDSTIHLVVRGCPS